MLDDRILNIPYSLVLSYLLSEIYNSLRHCQIDMHDQDRCLKLSTSSTSMDPGASNKAIGSGSTAICGLPYFRLDDISIFKFLSCYVSLVTTGMIVSSNTK